MTDQPLPEEAGVSLVLVGSFNPRIFHPSWFVRHGLLPESEEEAAQIEFIDNDICAFELDWVRVEVRSDRLMLGSLATPVPEQIRDLALGALLVLKHTPVGAIGMNSHRHYKLSDEDAWHSFGHRLAPKDELWSPILRQPGTLAVRIQGEHEDDPDAPETQSGRMQVGVEPSRRVQNGIYIHTNDEYRNTDASDAAWVTSIISQHWESTMSQAERVYSHVLRVATEDVT